jgi:hypothetical protein
MIARIGNGKRNPLPGMRPRSPGPATVQLPYHGIGQPIAPAAAGRDRRRRGHRCSPDSRTPTKRDPAQPSTRWRKRQVGAKSQVLAAYTPLGAKWGAIIGRHGATWNSLQRSHSIDYQVLSYTEPYWATAGSRSHRGGQGFKSPQLHRVLPGEMSCSGCGCPAREPWTSPPARDGRPPFSLPMARVCVSG